MSGISVTEPQWVDTMPRPARRMVEQPPVQDSLTGAGLRAVRDSMGLSAKDLAHALGASLRMVQIWETQDQIPAWVTGEVEFLIHVTEQWARGVASASGPISIHRDGWRIVEDDRIMPENWWRTIVGRAIGEGLGAQVQWDMTGK